jgi:DNA-binding Lrp family transcriptional regulator
MKTLDEKDELILSVLKEDAKLSTQQIARKVNIPITTIHNRIKKLESSNIIKGYTTIINNELLGNILAYVLISVSYNLADGKTLDQEELAKKIGKNKNIEEVNITAGQTDLIVKVRAKNIDELNDFVIKYLRTLPGIEKTQTLVVLKST